MFFRVPTPDQVVDENAEGPDVCIVSEILIMIFSVFRLNNLSFNLSSWGAGEFY